MEAAAAVQVTHTPRPAAAFLLSLAANVCVTLKFFYIKL